MNSIGCLDAVKYCTDCLAHRKAIASFASTSLACPWCSSAMVRERLVVVDAFTPPARFFIMLNAFEDAVCIPAYETEDRTDATPKEDLISLDFTKCIESVNPKCGVKASTTTNRCAASCHETRPSETSWPWRPSRPPERARGKLFESASSGRAGGYYLPLRSA